MEISPVTIAAYTGAGAATAAGFTALRYGRGPGTLALGAATGLAAGAAQSAVQWKTGSSELGWAAAVGTGALAGGLLLGGLAGPGMSQLKARGVGMAIGGIAGVLAPVVAGMALAQLPGNAD